MKPYTAFKKIARNLPDDYDANSKIKIDINPNLKKSQKSKSVFLLQKYDSVFSKYKWNLGDSKTEPVDISLTKNIPINLPNFKLSKFERDEIEVKHISLNLNNRNMHSQFENIKPKPYTAFQKVDQNLPHDSKD